MDIKTNVIRLTKPFIYSNGDKVNMEDFKKVMRIGTQKTSGGRPASIYIKVEYKAQRLSITGVVGPLPSGNCLGGCGQIEMEFKHEDKAEDDTRWNYLTGPSSINFAKGWTPNQWYKLLHIWHVYHLNDMNKLTVPDETLEYLKALPDTDKTPAWV